jgi:thioredoxin-dependent peroxiredoxin
MSRKPGPGDKAPDFKPDQFGTIRTLRSFSGKRLVLYFYPKDDTSGCTQEAIDFSGFKRDFEKAGAIVIGISPDSSASHLKFRSKHKLDLDLISDEAKSMLEAYGVWTEKSMYGRRYMGVERTTFLIGADETIAKVWNKLKVPGHAADVLAAVKTMASSGERLLPGT